MAVSRDKKIEIKIQNMIFDFDFIFFDVIIFGLRGFEI